jgi:hypothetical protein
MRYYAETQQGEIYEVESYFDITYGQQFDLKFSKLNDIIPNKTQVQMLNLWINYLDADRLTPYQVVTMANQHIALSNIRQLWEE